MPAHYWWIWIIVAAVFVVAEILTAGFFLLWFGVGAAVAGVLTLMGLGATWQLAAFVVVSFVLFLFSRRFADRFTKEQPPGIGADRFIGKQGVVIEGIKNSENKGRVRIDHEEWRAESASRNPTDVDAAISVTGISGTYVTVVPVEQGTQEGE